ncbi:MAG: hypothetical protein ACI32C_01305 [Candidatus Enteromonas sp.]
MKTNKFFRSLIIAFGCLFTICPNGEIDLEAADQTRFDFNLFRNGMKEPNDVVPKEAIANPYSDTIFIKNYFAPYYFSGIKKNADK